MDERARFEQWWEENCRKLTGQGPQDYAQSGNHNRKDTARAAWMAAQGVAETVEVTLRFKNQEMADRGIKTLTNHSPGPGNFEVVGVIEQAMAEAER